MSALIPPASVTPGPTSWPVRVAVFAVCLSALLLLVLPLRRLPLHVPINYNEGWNAYQADRAMTSQKLYPPSGDLVTNNYPPLSFYVFGAVGRLTGDNVIAGRLIAMSSFLLVGVNIAAVVFAGTRSVAMATYSAALFVLFGTTRWLDYVGMADPQWLAHAAALSGLSVMLYRPSQGVGVAAGTLTGLSLFVKHSVLPLPVALLVFLAVNPSRLMWAWAGGFLTSTAVVGVAGTAWFGWSMWEGILLSPRDLSVWYTAEKAEAFLTPAMPLAVAAFLCVWLDDDRRRLSLPVLYAATACVWGVYCLSADGVNYNAVFDVVISLCILVGLAGARQNAPLALPVRLKSGLMVATSVALLVPVPLALLQQYSALQQLDRRRLEAEVDVSRIANTPGRVACEVLVLCYWAGKPWEIDVFNTAQKLHNGTIPTKTLIDAFASHRYSMIQSGSSPSSTPKLVWMPRPINDALATYYAPVHQDSHGMLSTPRHE